MHLARKSGNAYEISWQIKILYAEQRKEVISMDNGRLTSICKIKHDNVFHQEKIKAETDLFVQLGL